MKNFLFSLFLFAYSLINAQLTVTYTGNMGILIANETTSVLVDGIHEKYGEDYLYPPEKLVKEFTKGSKKYFPPSILLFSHKHGDHFSAVLANKFIASNQESLIIGASQITKQIHEVKNTLLVSTSNYDKQLYFYKDIKIKAFKMDHVGTRHAAIENVGYIITIDNKNFLHVGDTNWNLKNNMFDQLALEKEKIDIAFLPYWMLLEKKVLRIIKKHLKKARIIATHISPQIDKKELDRLKNKFPEVSFLTILEEQIKI